MNIKDLVVTGDARILGKLYANGGVVGGGSSGGGGEAGGSGVTYTLSKSGSTITLTGSDGSTSSVTDSNTDTNTTYSAGSGLSLSGTTFSLAAHTHTKSQITDFPSSLPASDVYSWAKASSKPSYAWSEITGKPSTFSPSSHTHDDRYYTESEVNNLINGRAPAYQYSTTDLTAGSSALTTGTLYFVYV